MALTERDVLDAMESVIDPDLRVSVVEAGFVKDVKIDGSDVAVTLELTTPACPVKDQLKEEAVRALSALVNGGKVTVTMTARVRGFTAVAGLMPQVKQVILVGAGKGGVGKSTVALNLACALRIQGASVGLLDADFYGPSLPTMTGIARNPTSPDGKRLDPLDAHGLKLMSIGFLVSADQAVIWRGPMIHGALTQLLRDVQWGALDYLVIDLPPGTGDVPLSIAQQVSNRARAILVTTPQEVSLVDVTRAKKMFDALKIPIIGLVENMSSFKCPHCGEQSDIFASGGGRRGAAAMEVPFLGEIPLEIAVRAGGDRGLPIVIADPKCAVSRAFHEFASRAAAQVAIAEVAADRAQAAPQQLAT